MTTKLTSFILIFFFSISSFSQQIGDGFAPIITDFTIPLPSGVFNAITPIGSIPDTGSPTFGWQHLLIIRHPNPNNNHQLQIASSFNVNDRLFFRKLSGGLEPNNPTWIELATRGTNSFNGNQNIIGNLGVGTNASSNSNLEIFETSESKPNGQVSATKSILKLSRNGTPNYTYNENAEFRIGHGGDNYYGSKLDLYINGTSNTNSIPDQHVMTWNYNGYVGIGTTSPDSKLTVKGKIHAEEVKIDLAIPADYVFEKYYLGESSLKPDYTLLTLSEVEKFTAANHHLPNVPSAKEIKENGLLLGEMSNVLLQKIEELTLYVIEQNKRIEKLENENKKLLKK